MAEDVEYQKEQRRIAAIAIGSALSCLATAEGDIEMAIDCLTDYADLGYYDKLEKWTLEARGHAHMLEGVLLAARSELLDRIAQDESSQQS